MPEENVYPESREERVTGKPPMEDQPAELDKDSREYHALHGWPETSEEGG